MTRRALALALLFFVAAVALAEDEIAPNENLVAEGIPKIPAELAAAVSSYTEFRPTNFMSWHPTKREMLVASRVANVQQIHAVRAPGAQLEQLTFAKERTFVARYPRHRSDYFLFLRDTGGNEFYQLYRGDVAEKKLTLLTDGRSRNMFGPWSNRGDLLAYTSTRRSGKDNDIYVVDPTNPVTDHLACEVEGGGWYPTDWSPDDKQLLLLEMVSVNEAHLWLLDLETQKKTLLTHSKEKVSYGWAYFARDGKSILAASDEGSEFHRPVRIDRATGESAPLGDAIKWDVERFALSPDRKTIGVIANEDGTGTLHILDADTGAERPLPRLPTGHTTLLDFHENGQDLAFEVSNARSPSDVYSVNLASGAVERWTKSDTGGVDTSGFVEPELVRWKSFDERTISGWLYRPPTKFTGKRPVLILIHGGPEGQARPGFLGRNNYLLSELGIALVQPNVRGSTGYGKTFLELDNGMKREDSVKDIGALLDWIKTRDDLDADRVMVMGGSYGGYMSLACATHYDARLRGAIDVVGISNFVSFLEHTEAYRRDLRRVEYGDERDPKMREYLEKISPANNASKITKPLFVVQGKNDPRVPLEEAEQMVAAVRKNGTTVWYLMAKNEGHGFTKKDNADFLFYATVLFIRARLLGKEFQ